MYGEIVYKDLSGRFIVTSWSGRLFMYRDEQCEQCEKMAELINGQEGLRKQYKGSYETWYQKIREKKRKTVDSYRDQIERLQNSIDHLDTVWMLWDDK